MTTPSVSFTSLDPLVPFARLRAQRGLYDGRVSPRSQMLIALCTRRLTLSPEHGVKASE